MDELAGDRGMPFAAALPQRHPQRDHHQVGLLGRGGVPGHDPLGLDGLAARRFCGTSWVTAEQLNLRPERVSVVPGRFGGSFFCTDCYLMRSMGRMFKWWTSSCLVKVRSARRSRLSLNWVTRAFR